MGDGAVHVVLAHLCQHVDGSSLSAAQEGEHEADFSEEQSDREIFKCILRESDEYEVNFAAQREVRIDETAITTFPPQRQSLQEKEKDGCLFVVYDEEEASILKCEHASGGMAQVEFLGACIDTGAQMSVIGKQQAMTYFSYIGEEFKPTRQNRPARFNIGNRRHVGLGHVQIRIPIDDSHVLCPCIEVVDVDVPLLLGLDFLDDYKMNVDTANDMLESKSLIWSLPLTRTLGHLYLEWDYETFFTSEELRKLHNHFFHPESGRLYSMLKRADDSQTTPSDLKELERIASECNVCQRNIAASSKFRTALPSEDVVFNRCLCMDIMFLEGMAVLHMVDKDTKFRAAAFLPEQTADKV